MSSDNQLHEDVGKLKAEVGISSASISRVQDSVDNISIVLSKVSQQMDDSLDRDKKADILISQISEEVSVLSHVQKEHKKSIKDHTGKIEELESLANLIKFSKTYTRAIWGFLAAGIVAVSFYYLVNKSNIESKEFELRSMQLQADIEQKKKREENNLERYKMKSGRTIEKTIKETNEGL